MLALTLISKSCALRANADNSFGVFVRRSPLENRAESVVDTQDRIDNRAYHG